MIDQTEQKPDEKPMKKFGGKQEGAGRPKTVISPEDTTKAGELAKKGHRNGTICTLMDWDRQWLEKREDLLTYFAQKRAEGQDELLTTLRDQAKKNPVSAIFLSKQAENHGGLGFADKQELNVSGSIATRELSKAELAVLLKEETIPCDEAMAK